MIGFALEGGGAKGAYQAGAYIALIQNGIKPDIIAGTSIGSLNAALMAQGDIKKLVDLWLNTTTDIFGINSEIIEKIKHKKFTKNDIKPTYDNILSIIKNKGIDTSEYFKIIKDNVDEEKLRKSKVKFGLITVKLDGIPKPLELTIDDIPKGKVAEYILASCYLPVFKLNPIIDNNYYLDGGFYNNVPISLVQNYGCKTVYSLRIKGIGFRRNKINKDTKVIDIISRKSLGQTIIFDRESNERNMRLGYYDALKVIKNLDGINYYFKYKNNKYYDRIVRNVDKKVLNWLKIRYRVRTNKDLIIKVIEKILVDNNVDIFNVLDIKKCIFKMKYNYLDIKDDNIKSFIKSCKLL